MDTKENKETRRNNYFYFFSPPKILLYPIDCVHLSLLKEMYWPSLTEIVVNSFGDVLIPVVEWHMTLMNILLWGHRDPLTGDRVDPCAFSSLGSHSNICPTVIFLDILLFMFEVVVVVGLIDGLIHKIISLFAAEAGDRE